MRTGRKPDEVFLAENGLDTGILAFILILLISSPEGTQAEDNGTNRIIFYNARIYTIHGRGPWKPENLKAGRPGGAVGRSS